LSRYFTEKTKDNHETPFWTLSALPRIELIKTRHTHYRLSSRICWGPELRASRKGHSFKVGHSVRDVNELAEPIPPTPPYTRVGFRFTVVHYPAPRGTRQRLLNEQMLYTEYVDRPGDASLLYLASVMLREPSARLSTANDVLEWRAVRLNRGRCRNRRRYSNRNINFVQKIFALAKNVIGRRTVLLLTQLVIIRPPSCDTWNTVRGRNPRVHLNRYRRLSYIHVRVQIRIESAFFISWYYRWLWYFVLLINRVGGIFFKEFNYKREVNICICQCCRLFHEHHLYVCVNLLICGLQFRSVREENCN
jgi:hypothetical protein